jgi:hypothetical protein
MSARGIGQRLILESGNFEGPSPQVSVLNGFDDAPTRPAMTQLDASFIKCVLHPSKVLSCRSG